MKDTRKVSLAIAVSGVTVSAKSASNAKNKGERFARVIKHLLKFPLLTVDMSFPRKIKRKNHCGSKRRHFSKNEFTIFSTLLLLAGQYIEVLFFGIWLSSPINLYP